MTGSLSYKLPLETKNMKEEASESYLYALVMVTH